MNALADSSESFNDFEYRLRTPSLSVRWVRMKGVPARGKRGKRQGYRGATLDITNRLVAQLEASERENTYRDTVGKVPGVVFQWYEPSSGTGCFRYVSPNVQDLLDITAADLLENPGRLTLKSWIVTSRVTGDESGTLFNRLLIGSKRPNQGVP